MIVLKLKHSSPLLWSLNSQLYSHYKGTHTSKCLIGTVPHGVVTFVSSLYTGCTSDVEITKLSGILDLLEPGDDVMADKGFTFKKMLEDRGVTLNIHISAWDWLRYFIVALPEPSI